MADSTWEELKSRWIGRDAQVDRFRTLMGTKSSAVPCLIVTGQTATGKSALVRDIFSAVGVPHAYVDCVESSTPRAIFDTVTNQLFNHVPSEANGFASHSKSKDLGRFIATLREIDHPPTSTQIVESTAGEEEEGSSSQPAPAPSSDRGRGQTKYVVFDNADRLRGLDEKLVQSLLRLDELTSSNICSVLITSVNREQLEGMLCTCPCVRVHFDCYSRTSVQSILERGVPHGAQEKLWRECVKMTINVFWGQNKSLVDLRDILSCLYPKFAQPIIAGEATIDDHARLFRLLKPALRVASSRTFLRDLEFDQCDDDGDDEKWGFAGGTGMAAGVVDVELSYHSKHLLLAAYLAAHSPPQRDVATFSLTHAGPLRRKKKGGASAAKPYGKPGDEPSGPRTFALERLLAIFYSIMIDPVEASSELLSQVSGLVSMNLITSVGGEDSGKYRCNASHQLVRAVGSLVQVDVDKYIYTAKI